MDIERTYRHTLKMALLRHLIQLGAVVESIMLLFLVRGGYMNGLSEASVASTILARDYKGVSNQDGNLAIYKMGDKADGYS